MPSSGGASGHGAAGDGGSTDTLHACVFDQSLFNSGCVFSE
jgi:hypothetical protein